MRFIDETTISVSAGNGGRGCVSFRREKYRPKGGPDGGNGGDGGDIVLVATNRAATLLDLKFNQHYKAQSGQSGQGKDMIGRMGKTIEIAVPIGTLVYNDDTGTLIEDMVDEGQRLCVAKGGMGGRGNAKFVSSIRQAPEYAQPGQAGESSRIRLELKLLADVGLVGFPNAGKSTLIRQMSRSKARVADYPFTTLVPNLGVVTYEDDRAFVIADVPGLIEGAADGAGLGHQFLRHIERTRVLVYLVEVTGGMMPSEAYRILLSELTRYEAELAQRPSIICINKCDLVDEDTLQLALEDMAEAGITNPVFLSALEGTGTDALRDRIVAVLDPH